MHFTFLIFVSVLVGYGAGLGFEVLADGDDSKIQRLINQNEVDPNWIPFGIVGKMYYNQDIVDSAYLEYYGTPGLIGVGHLDDDQSPISAASVAFDVGIRAVQNNGKTSFQNVVNMCIFHSPQSFDQLCLICKLVDDSGEEDVLVGSGLLVEDREYMGSDIEEIEVFSIPEVEPGMLAANDVQDVSKVQLEICRVAGCTPGFWKTHSELGPASFNAWPTTGFTTDQKYLTVFGISPLGFEIKFDGGTVTDPTLIQALGAQGGNLNAFARHSTAALLSASSNLVIIPLTVAEVIAIVQGVDFTDENEIEAIKDFFAAKNELGCPIGSDSTGVLQNLIFEEESGGGGKKGKK